MLFTLLIGNIQVLTSINIQLISHDYGKKCSASNSYDFDALGVLACGDGEEEKDATEVSETWSGG